MKRTLTAAALAVLASTSFAATQAASAPDFQSVPPTIEEVVAELYRLDGGQRDEHGVPVAQANRINAGDADAFSPVG